MSSADRSIEVGHYIDPGFVNHRLVETVLGEPGTRIINELVKQIPGSTPAGQLPIRVNHVYTRITLDFCRTLGVPTLRKILSDRSAALSCSTEMLAPSPEIYEAERVEVPIVLDAEHELIPELHFSTRHIISDTTRMELHRGGIQSFVAQAKELRGNRLILYPLIIGAPWLETDDPKWRDNIAWYGQEFYEQFVEDFAEFEEIKRVEDPNDFALMEKISEKAFKTCLAEILGDRVVGDWGGEQSDHYTSHLTLGGRRVSAAFLLKGPARFQPMTLNNLGKNNDQIVRLANEPADVLVVQHSHDITQPVRATLRAFAVQPSRPRRYCLIDGRDSLRLLRAYDKVERALELSGKAA